MATGRTVGSKYTRIYIDGYDMSGYTRSVGNLEWGFNANSVITLTDEVTGAYPGQCSIGIGDVNTVMDNTATTGPHAVFASDSDAVRDVMIPVGIRAVPAEGDPVFCAQVAQNSYNTNVADEVITVNIDLGTWDERGDSKAYPYPWGHLIHANGAETGVNTGTYDYAVDAATTKGGYMMYQVFPESTGTCTFKIQDSTGGAWSDLVSSGVLTLTETTGQSAIVPLGCTGTVNKNLRWQIDLGTAMTATFALAFVRGR